MAGILEYKCPCCGGAIAFDSGSQKMKCPFCGNSFDVETLRAFEKEMEAKEDGQDEWKESGEARWQSGEEEGLKIYTCQSCGGEIVGDENMAAAQCPFCGNNVVIVSQFRGDLRPDYVIPFKLNREQAKEAFYRHLKGKRLLPKVFKAQSHIDEIQGIYVPFWLYDSDVDADMRFRATRVRTWSDSKYNYTETLFYLVSREGKISFSRVPADGSSKIDDTLMESIEPFDYGAAVDFQTAYLAGYLADRYDVGPEETKKHALARMRASTESAFASTVRGFATVTPEKSNIRIRQGEVKYALLPVWVLHTSWKGNHYLFAMNGQTGKFAGDLPMDRGAYWKWFLGVAGSLWAVGIAASLLLL